MFDFLTCALIFQAFHALANGEDAREACEKALSHGYVQTSTEFWTLVRGMKLFEGIPVLYVRCEEMVYGMYCREYPGIMINAEDVSRGSAQCWATLAHEWAHSRMPTWLHGRGVEQVCSTQGAEMLRKKYPNRPWLEEACELLNHSHS